MLNGYDYGSVNGSGIQTVGLSGQFAIVKVSEGKTWPVIGTDQYNLTNVMIAAARNKVGMGRGWYEYAWPENGGVNDGGNFLRMVTPKAGEIPALDFEPYKSSLRYYPDKWGLYIWDFGRTVFAKCGAWPALYLNDYFGRQLMNNTDLTVMNNIRQHFPLWKAGYKNTYSDATGAPLKPTSDPGDIFGWTHASFFQWNASSIDKDVFYGTLAEFYALGVPGMTPPPVPPSDGGPVGIFPLPKGHYYSVPNWSSYCHSGYFNSADRPAIKAIQREVGVTADGFFGPNTLLHVEQWQNHYGLAADGKVGALTWAKMVSK